MGIDYNAGTETITVTGGSFEEPYTMAILDTGDEYGSAPKDFYIRVVKNDILAFFRRALSQMRCGGQYDAYKGIDLEDTDHGDRCEVSIEDGKRRPFGSANAPFHATFTAHFAEGSQRFWEGDSQHRESWLRIPITDGNEVWYENVIIAP